jgi:hypothetical protein
MTESAAWHHDWTSTSVIIGAQLSGVSESGETRERVRRRAQARLNRPADRANQAFPAEILAGASSY